MIKKLRYLGIFLILGLSMVSCVASRLPPSIVMETATPGPKIKTTLVSFEVQAGNTDVVVILGILIFVFIVVPILLHYKDWRLPQKMQK
jgi:hypothetical protein